VWEKMKELMEGVTAARGEEEGAGEGEGEKEASAEGEVSDPVEGTRRRAGVCWLHPTGVCWLHPSRGWRGRIAPNSSLNKHALMLQMLEGYTIFIRPCPHSST